MGPSTARPPTACSQVDSGWIQEDFMKPTARMLPDSDWFLSACRIPAFVTANQHSFETIRASFDRPESHRHICRGGQTPYRQERIDNCSDEPLPDATQAGGEPGAGWATDTWSTGHPGASAGTLQLEPAKRSPRSPIPDMTDPPSAHRRAPLEGTRTSQASRRAMRLFAAPPTAHVPPSEVNPLGNQGGVNEAVDHAEHRPMIRFPPTATGRMTQECPLEVLRRTTTLVPHRS